jgi:hypothetical protein
MAMLLLERILMTTSSQPDEPTLDPAAEAALKRAEAKDRR